MTETQPGAALVTGAGRRIGRAVALALASEGWHVAIHYHASNSAAEDVVREIETGGGRAVALGADLTLEDQVSGLVAKAAAVLGPITCLINNASVFENDSIETATRESWDRHMETNLRAPFVLTQQMVVGLPDGAEGHVINILDERVWSLTPYFASYTLSKAALWTFTQTAALALAPRIRVNGIGPGPTLPSPRQTQEQFDRQCAQMPLGRGTTPEEIGEAVRFILNAPAMTGQMIALDGGQHLGWAQPDRSAPPEE